MTVSPVQFGLTYRVAGNTDKVAESLKLIKTQAKQQHVPVATRPLNTGEYNPRAPYSDVVVAAGSQEALATAAAKSGQDTVSLSGIGLSTRRHPDDMPVVNAAEALPALKAGKFDIEAGEIKA